MTYSSKTPCPDRVLPSTLHTSHCTLHSSHSKLLTSHCFLHTPNLTLHTSHCTLHTSQSTLHTSQSTLHTSHFTVHTSHFALHTPHFTVHTSHFSLHTSHFSLLPSHSKLHTSHFALHTPHFTVHTSHFSLHTSHFSLLPSHSKLLTSHCFHRQLIHQHHLHPHLQCGNDPTVANHNGILSTAHARKTVETPFAMRNRSDHDPRISDHDPNTHETVSHPSHRRGRSSRFGDELCMEKHRVSCICYLSKTHFVRDFLHNSIGNSSTTCNPIYSEGTISLLTLSVTNSFPH